MSESHQCQDVLVILLLMFTIWETILHKHNYLPLGLLVLPLFQSLILEPVKTGTQTFLSLSRHTSTPSTAKHLWQGVDKAPSEDAALSLAMIQVGRQVWPVSQLRHIKLSGVNTILSMYTHICALHLSIYTSGHQVFINVSAQMQPTALNALLQLAAGFYSTYSLKPLSCDTVPQISFQLM